MWYMIVPAKISSVNYENKQIVLDYSEQLAANSVDMANLKSQIDTLTTERDNLSRELSGYTGENGESNMYSLLIDAADAYVDYDFAQALVLLQKIDVALLPTQAAKNVYNTMLESCSGGADRFYSQGTKAYLEKDYISAANYFEAALIYDETNDEAAAAAYYEDFLTKFPQSGYVPDVTARLAALNAVLNPTTEAGTQEDAQQADETTAADTQQ